MTKKNILPFYNYYNRCIYWLCGQNWFQLVFFSNMLAPIKNFYDHQCPTINENEFIRQFLFNNSGDLRDLILFSNSTDRIMSQIQIEGEENLLVNTEHGQGLILVNFHSGLSKINHLVLKRMGLARNTFSIAKSRPNKNVDNKKDSDMVTDQARADVYTTQTLQAADVLLNGGVVLISIDGEKGRNKGVAVPFLGRWHLYKTGFAELALATDVPVIPFSTSLFHEGTMKIKFIEPIDKGDDQMTKEVRIEKMVKQLSTFVAQQWITTPSSIKYKKLLYHLNQPVVEDRDQVPVEVFMKHQDSPKVHGFPYKVLRRIRQYKKNFIQKKMH